MGQYYFIVNETKREYLCAHDYDQGLKLMEHSYLGINLVCAAEALIGPGNPWEGDVIRWEGDYADPPGLDRENRYHEARESYTRLKGVVPLPKSRRFVVNHDKELFVDTEKQPQSRFQIHPWPLLIVNGNGRGGGDYSGANMQLVGSWAGNRVVTMDEVPAGYKELEVLFKEKR
jgi:hypothetical protein